MSSGFFDSLFGGKSAELNTLIGQFGQTGAQQTGAGQKNQNTASNCWDAIVGGDSSKTMQALAPEVSAEKTSAANQNKTNAMFGTRSGGNTASAAATNDKVHSDITNLIGSLTNSSASNLASLGTSQVSTGLSSLGMEQGATAERMKNWEDSILGRGITTAVSAAETYALQAL